MNTITILNEAIHDYSNMDDPEQEEHVRNVKKLAYHLSTHVLLYPRKFYHCTNCLCAIPNCVKESTIHVLRITCHTEHEIYTILEVCVNDLNKELLFTMP